MTKCPSCGHTWGSRKLPKFRACPECGSNRHSDHASYLRLLVTQRLVIERHRWPTKAEEIQLRSIPARVLAERLGV